MDIKEFNSRFSSKMEQIKQFTSGDEIKDILGSLYQNIKDIKFESKSQHHSALTNLCCLPF